MKTRKTLVDRVVNRQGKFMMTDRQAELVQVAREQAKLFHEAYERLASAFGYATRSESAKPWDQVPESNRKLMEATCVGVLTPLLAAQRAAVLEEAAAYVEEQAFVWWKEYKSGESHRADPSYQGMSDGAEMIAAALRSKAQEQRP